jgi:hypothetical protein
MGVKCTDDATTEDPGRPLHVLPVDGVNPETTAASALVPCLDKGHQAAVVDEKSADFAKLLR